MNRIAHTSSPRTGSASRRSPLLAVLMSAALLATACGGDGEADAPPVAGATTVLLSGTAAAGLPLVGSVSVKDAKGVVRTAPLGANGGYSLDVTGMTAPLLLRAEGQAGSTRYVLHSATVTADANNTVNITPLTDLIVANVAGQIADTYFASGNFASMTRTELDAESAALKAKLLPVLLAMNVDASLDLLRTPFTPLASALDHALDVIRVSVEPVTTTATITNVVTQVTIADDLSKKATAETPVTLQPGANLGTATSDIDAVRAALTGVTDLLKTGLPTESAVLAKMTQDFLHSSYSRTDIAGMLAGESDLIGATFTQIEIVGINYEATGGPLATVTYVMITKDGKVDTDLPETTQMRKGNDGVWRWRGNQDVVDFFGGPSIYKNLTTGCTFTGYEFNLEDNGHAALSSVNELRVHGPGLPTAGMRFRRSTGEYQWLYTNPGNNNPYSYRFNSANCAGLGAGIADSVIAAIPDNAVYTLTAFNADGAQVSLGNKMSQKRKIPKRALTLAETLVAKFPTVTTSTPFETYAGGNLTISGADVNPLRTVWVYLSRTLQGGEVASNDNDVIPTGTGTYSTTLSAGTGGTVTAREIRVATRDEYGRSIMSNVTR